MNAVWIALGFLTRFPAKHADFNPVDAARAVFWFPAVGLLVGGLVWSAVHLTAPALGQDLAALLGLGLWVWVTGALHLDGLADTFDGFSASSGGKTRALEAMKDSRIGAHGACALGLLLLGKLVVLRRCIDVGALVPAVVVATMFARLAVGFLLAWAKTGFSYGLRRVVRSGTQNQAWQVDPVEQCVLDCGAGGLFVVVTRRLANGRSEHWRFAFGRHAGAVCVRETLSGLFWWGYR